MKTELLYQGYFIYEDEKGYFYNSKYWGKTYVEKDYVLKLNK